MRTTWVGVPKEVRDAAVPLLQAHGRLLPAWVRVLEVTFDDTLVESFAECESEPTYHRVKLIFGSAWLNCDPVKREWVVAHELLHPTLASIERAWDQMSLALPKKMRLVADKMFDDAVEEAVSGLAYALVKDGE